MLPVELHGEVIRNLSAHADDDAARFFDVNDVEHALQRQFIEVEAVAHVVVGRHGFGVIVDHHALITLSAGGLDGIHGTPVELNARADAIGTRTQHHNGGGHMGHVLQTRVVVFRVCKVEVVGLLLGSNGVNATHLRQDATLFALLTHFEVLLLHVAAGRLQHETGYLEV